MRSYRKVRICPKSKPSLRHLLISHHTGTFISTLSDHTIELMAIVKLSVNIQNAREHGAMLRDLSRFLDSEASTSTHAKRFAMGTRGYVGSIAENQEGAGR